ncbi:Spo0E like sporulation regulatory protein [Salsuginibacillus halophilus]|uniref:Spo0E like sporulation regulatory protein n=1 Tax=Salsuginibacillus halophilus TaxID=517424 RepID=A0A2P8HE31_9BACI|nr:aspartyl-phosphate phosphatase Spo0E family protein [Salsuginibacillus halophilus]PSL44462.1 Spo0E like sporulation regulatory protein [Salsuginibacillus halophilus]
MNSRRETDSERLLEEFRNKMMKAAAAHGFHHPEVIYYSQMVDLQHNNLLEEKKSDRKCPMFQADCMA